MPLSLPDLQAAFAAHVAGDDQHELVASVIGDSISAQARLRVHRHHVFSGLVKSLAATFATVQALVGEAFFQAMARAFAAGCLPAQPVLSEYGAGFAEFVEGYEPARALTYLADVARLDWALNTAFHSPAEPRLTSAGLAAIPAEELPGKSVSLAAGAAIIRSSYPIDRICRVARSRTSNEIVDLGAGEARLLVLRGPDDVGFISLGAGEARFLEALQNGVTLEEAAGTASAADDAFDLSSCFSRLLASQAFAALQ
jgi:hypothetical protein